MQLVEVTTPALAQKFIQVAVDLYKDDPNFIRPLDKDVEQVFDPKQNKFFRHGECTRWLLVNDQGKIIGRVAAFIDKRTASKFEQPTGGMGFFECINDQTAANLLFEQCQTWLTARGMEAMDGPINFGDRDKWWGLLVDEFSPASYATNYNFPYYRQLFEAYGFQVYFKQFTYYRKVMEPLSERYITKAKAIYSHPDYAFRHLERNKLTQYAEDFRKVYNLAWGKHQGVKEMSSAQAMGIMQKLKPILDERIMWFAYYKSEPVGFFISIPELNQLFKYVNGKLDVVGKIKFVYHKWKGSCTRMCGIVFGISPEHQRKGVEAAMIYASSTYYRSQFNFPYQDIVMNWIGDFNPKMMRVAEQIEAQIFKTHFTYRKLFDEAKEFKRAPII
ncbi:hypothetical protein AHMF7605_04245 [Adhaeribacter arboris]|uniref:N-acetyltransferase n=1 Tax=Adhaeribacter arboris TaxID=2072846 RepID=A0A2T2YBB2_9BACT|nr:hypothetical protein [Adhaeribacter arboris]PSR52789.1 hypothetical protein AHMF7605_04245 [Adhaeribacter arboris]